MGVRARVDGQAEVLRSARTASWRALGHDTRAAFARPPSGWPAEGKRRSTPPSTADGGRDDRRGRPDQARRSREAIAALHALGLKVAMITGDNRARRRRSPPRLGIDEVVAEVLPAARSPRSTTCKAAMGRAGLRGRRHQRRARAGRADVGSPSAPAPMSPSRPPTWC
jgi:hypothetical protein